MNFKKTALDYKGKGLTEFPKEIFEHKRVHKLNLSNNKISRIPSEITQLRHLEMLDLSNNDIRILHAKLFELPRLKILILNNNRIVSLPKQIEKLKQLKILHLASNKLAVLAPEIAGLESLEELNLTENNLQDLPLYIGSFPNLKTAWLAHNPLKVMTTDRLLNGMGKLKSIYFYSPKIENRIQSEDKYLKLASERKGNCLQELKGDFEILESLQDFIEGLRNPDFKPIKKPSEKPTPTINDKPAEPIVEQTTTSKIFISYSHADGAYLKQLDLHLKAMAFDIKIDAWADTRLRSSNNWFNEIIKAMNEASDIILLVSTAFLASDFIRTTELPLALKNAETKGVRIHSVIISPCGFKRVKSISALQTPNNPEKPLSGCTFTEQEEIWVKLCEDIELFLEEDKKKV